MDGETPAMRPEAQPATDATARLAPFSQTAATERFGPLVIERRRKDDGRALLLFELREPEP